MSAHLKGEMDQYCIHFDGGSCDHEKWDKDTVHPEVSSSYCSMCKDRVPSKDYL